jgi:hypothetical protein
MVAISSAFHCLNLSLSLTLMVTPDRYEVYFLYLANSAFHGFSR